MKDRKTLSALGLVAVVAVVAAGASSARSVDHRGGTMKLLAKAAGGTLDPQVNYTLQYWQLYQATYDGLLAFKKAGGGEAFKVVPDLASGYKITNAGKTWVFTLRKGIKFSNGQTVTVKDVVASFQRIFKVKSPTSGGFYSGIVGAAQVPEDAGDVHAGRRRCRQREGQHGDDQPDVARPRVQVQARRPARVDPAGKLAPDGRGHEADPGDRAVLLRFVRLRTSSL